MRAIRIALAQINTSVGDLDGNARKIAEGIRSAREAGAQLAVFPELAITGYPPEDLVFYPRFVADNRARLEEVAREARGIAALVGFVDGLEDRAHAAHNAAAVLDAGRVAHVYHKIHLPNYGVFDEVRYFQRGYDCPVMDLDGTRVGISICEDVWHPLGPTEVERAAGAEVSVNPNASPFHVGKHGERLELLSRLAVRNQMYVCYVNQVGGQDELVFDGTSIVMAPDGTLLAQGARFDEDMLVVDLDMEWVERVRDGNGWESPSRSELDSIGRPVFFGTESRLKPPENPRPLGPRDAPLEQLGEEAEIYKALTLGTRDYVQKIGFSKVIVALSGGVDSALTAVIAADAFGPDNVLGVSMPSRFSSEGSVSDAADLAGRLGIEMWSVPIEPAHSAFEDMLAGYFEGTQPNVAEENVQSRIRGNVVMTIANKFGYIALTTGNKSEVATGYATLYGDMAGGYNVLKDVPKTVVYRLCEHRNRVGPGSPIPQSVIDKPPSAELRPGQLDQDSLPPYEVLDRIIHRYVEQRWDLDEIAEAEAQAEGPHADRETVVRMLNLIDRNEYKRRQGPPGVKITGLAFGRDRRMPIAQKYSLARR